MLLNVGFLGGGKWGRRVYSNEFFLFIQNNLKVGETKITVSLVVLQRKSLNLEINPQSPLPAFFVFRTAAFA